jgi:hypothetical protein
VRSASLERGSRRRRNPATLEAVFFLDLAGCVRFSMWGLRTAADENELRRKRGWD